MNEIKRLISYRDLDVYQSSYQKMLTIHNEIISKLPKEEEYDLKSQLRRATKAIPRLIAEGYAKRHQRKGFQKYIDDAMAESNETIVSLSEAVDLYTNFIDSQLCHQLIDAYDKISRQLYNLALAWEQFNRCTRKTITDTSYDTDTRKTVERNTK